MSEDNKGQSGGININGTVGAIYGSMAGRDQTITTTYTIAAHELESAFHPLVKEVESASPEVHADAKNKLDELQKEVAKGKEADDGVVARLVDGLVALVPNAASAIASTFAAPVLEGLTGPVTSFVLSKLQGN